MRRLSATWLLVGLTAVPAVASGSGPSNPLVDAINSRNPQALRLLLDRHVDVNAREADGTTPLHRAARIDDVEAMRLLLRAGASVNVANRYGVTPLMLAATNGSSAAVDTLRPRARLRPIIAHGRGGAPWRTSCSTSATARSCACG